MPSFGTLKADTLTHSTAGSVGTDFVVQGSAKQWAFTNGAGTVVNDSFNLSSLADTATGNQTYNLTNSMGNTNYSILLTVNEQSDYYIFERSVTYPRSASQFTGAVYSDASSNYADGAQGSQLNGDLA